jgi:lipopolysaccharide/colanic/teichoic acid biosynthesis glycosyltransferase
MKLFSKVLGKLLRRGAFNGIHSPEEFRLMLERERARADRSGSKFSLVVFDFGNTDGGSGSSLSVEHLTRILFQRIRITDTVGWFDDKSIGTVLPGTTGEGAWKFVDDVSRRVTPTPNHLDFKIYTYPNKGLPHEEGYPEQLHFPGFFHELDKAMFHAIFSNRNSTTNGKSASVWLNHVNKLQVSKIPIEGLENLLVQRIPFWKRVIDIAGAIFLLITSFPIFVMVALWIKIVSPGPVLFKQERLGRIGKPFILWKFRTMGSGADESVHKQHITQLIQVDKPLTKLDSYKDSRIIPLGNFLRKLCIDELPQLVNVLCGEMSLVGPRPDVLYSVQHYLPWETNRLDAIPGLTGLWQVSGKNRTTFKDMVRFDIRYARERSFWFDAKILLMTIPAVFAQVTGRTPKLKQQRVK